MFDEKKDNLNPAVPEDAASEATAAEETAPAAEAAADAAPEAAESSRKPEAENGSAESAAEEKDSSKAGKTKKAKKKKFSVWIHSTRFKHGSLSSVFVVGVLVLAVLINVGATALVNRFPSLRLDMTANQRLSLNEDFTEVIDKIDVPTEIIFCAGHDTVENTVNNILANQVGGDAMNEGTRLLELVSKASERNGNIKVSYVDLETNPGFTSEYPNESLTAYSIIIKSDKRHKVLAISDLYKSSQDSYGNTTYVSNIEYAIGNAMLAVNVDKLPIVGVVTGHGETTPSVLTSLLSDNNFEIQTVDLMLSQPIDSSIDVIVINAPTGDYTPEQIQILEDFLINEEKYGKNIVVMLSPMQDTSDMPNFKAFMADWGIGVQESGSIVMESDNSHYVGNALTPLLQFGEETIFDDYSNGVAIAYAVAPIEVLWDSHSGIAVSTVLSTYDSTYSVSTEDIGTYEPKDEDKKSYPVMTISAKGVSGSTITYSRVITLASTEMFNYYTQYGSAKNSDCAVTLFRFLSGTTGDENKVYISPTKLTTSDFTVSSSMVNMVGMTIFMILVPLLVLAVGLIVWLRRRHL